MRVMAGRSVTLVDLSYVCLHSDNGGLVEFNLG